MAFTVFVVSRGMAAIVAAVAVAVRIAILGPPPLALILGAHDVCTRDEPKTPTRSTLVRGHKPHFGVGRVPHLSRSLAFLGVLASTPSEPVAALAAQVVFERLVVGLFERVEFGAGHFVPPFRCL